MKKYTFITLAFLFLSTSWLTAQSILEQAGGVITNFILSSDSIVLPIEKQVLIRRAVSEHYFDRNLDGGMGGFGYGYQSLHLEFISTRPLVLHKRLGEKKELYLFKFFDDNQQLIAQIEFQPEQIKLHKYPAASPKYVYSINLKDIPIILLDQTKEINMAKYELRMK